MKVSQVFESVIAELDRAKGTTFRIVLEVQAESTEGFSKDVEDDVVANAQALAFSHKQFDRKKIIVSGPTLRDAQDFNHNQSAYCTIWEHGTRPC